MIKIVEKGYRIEIKSWENDGDYRQTKVKIVSTKEEAKLLYNLLLLCKTNKLGNKEREELEQGEIDIIINFLKSNNLITKEDIENKEELNDIVLDIFSDLTHDLLGSSEYYYCRVFESCKITYSPEDIYLEEIVF